MGRGDESAGQDEQGTRLELPEGSLLLAARFDASDRLIQANAAFRQAFGLSPGERPGWEQLLRAAQRAGRGMAIDADDAEAGLRQAARRRRVPQRAYAADLRDGRWLWVTETVEPDGGLFMLACDITALRPVEPASQQLAAAELDPHSGLLLAAPLMRQLAAVLANSASWPLCVIWTAIDAGPAAPAEPDPAAATARLRHFGRQLLAGVRREDGCGRLAENGFVLVLPTAGRGQAGAVAERLLARVRRSAPEGAAAYRCSAGLAEAVWGDTADVLLERARVACVAAAAAGGDRLVCAD